MQSLNLYNSHDLAISIKNRAKRQGVSIKSMLEDLNLGSNTMSALYHGRSMAFDSLARIADYLECSVDYLLGRTDIPEINRTNTPEQTYQLKIAARGGGVKEITVTDSQLKAIINLPEVKDLSADNKNRK